MDCSSHRKIANCTPFGVDPTRSKDRPQRVKSLGVRGFANGLSDEPRVRGEDGGFLVNFFIIDKKAKSKHISNLTNNL